MPSPHAPHAPYAALPEPVDEFMSAFLAAPDLEIVRSTNYTELRSYIYVYQKEGGYYVQRLLTRAELLGRQNEETLRRLFEVAEVSGSTHHFIAGVGVGFTLRAPSLM